MALDPSAPFTVATAVANGVSAKQLEGTGYQRLFQGVYVRAGVAVTAELRGRAALLRYPADSYLSFASAARLYGAPVPTISDDHVTVWAAAERRRIRGIVCHVQSSTAQLTHLAGMRVSGPDQLFAEMAALIDLVDLVVLGDWLVRQEWTTPQRLVDFCARRRGAGAALARRAAGYVRERVDSPMESRLRMLIVLAGLPEPAVNLSLRDQLGNVVRRHDLCYPSRKLAIEYDGRLHVERIENWESDRDRREASDNDGWRVLTIVSRDIYVDPGRTVERIWQVGRSLRVPGMPVRPSEQWRAHFPGRS